MKNKVIIFSLASITFLIDRILKNFILDMPVSKENIIFDSSIIDITKVYNSGAAFGILQGYSKFLLIFSVFVILFLVFYIFKNHKTFNKLQISGIGLLLGGTAGNFYDRALYGYVIDFIKPNFINFPVFNLADIFINIGVLLILIEILLFKSIDEK